MTIRLRAAALTATALLALTACASEDGEGSSWDSKGVVHQHQVQLDDGRTITCISWKSGYAGSIQCDWQEAA